MDSSDHSEHIDRKISYQKKDIKSKEKFRWALLIMAICSQCGGHVAFAFPAYFELQLKEVLNISTVQYNLLWTVQYVPNLIMPFIAGLLPKKFGLGKTLLFFMFMLFFGQFFQLISILSHSYILLMCARLFVGIGFVNSQTLLVVQITNWFIGKEIGFSLSCQMMMGKIGLAGSGYFFSLYQDPNNTLVEPIFYIFLFGLFCLILSISSVYFDYTEPLRKLEKTQSVLQNNQKSIKESIKGLGKLYWMIIILGTMVNCIYYPFLSNVQLFLKDKYQIIGRITNFCYVLPIFMSAAFAPIVGYFCDYTGNFRSMWSFSAIFAIIPFGFYYGQVNFENNDINAALPIALLGIFYGIANTIRQPCIRFAVDKDDYTIATGISISLINFGLLIFPIIFGYLFQMQNGIQILVQFLLICSIVYFLGSVYLEYYDQKHDNIMIVHHKKDQDENVLSRKTSQNQKIKI